MGDIEDFRKSLRTCPKCKSAEGFWLSAKRDETYFQCKNCGAILEACEVFPNPKASKDSKKLFIKLQR